MHDEQDKTVLLYFYGVFLCDIFKTLYYYYIKQDVNFTKTVDQITFYNNFQN